KALRGVGMRLAEPHAEQGENATQCDGPYDRQARLGRPGYGKIRDRRGHKPLDFRDDAKQDDGHPKRRVDDFEELSLNTHARPSAYGPYRSVSKNTKHPGSGERPQCNDNRSTD